jgi:hypothetical protein
MHKKISMVFIRSIITLNGYLSNRIPQIGLPKALNKLEIEPTVDKNLSLLINVSPKAF